MDAFFVKPLTSIPACENTEFISSVDKGGSNWLQERFAEQAEYGNLKSCNNHKIAIGMFDRNKNPNSWLNNLFLDPKQMKALFQNHPEWDADDHFITSEASCKMVQKARAGNGNPQFQCYNAWTKTGFGIWAHVFPGYGAQVGAAAQNEINSEFGISSSVYPSHLINAPPGGAALAGHIDGHPPPVLLKILIDEMIAASNDGASVDWGNFKESLGYQSLVHLDGAREANDGTTWTFSNMTPCRLALMLILMRDDASGKFQDFWSKKEGPYFFPVQPALELLNKAILACKEGEILFAFSGVIKHDGLGVVKKVAMNNPDGPYICAWIKGMPHGKDPNKTRRLSIGMGLRFVNPEMEPTRRSKRARDFAELDSSCEVTATYAKKRILDDKVPLSNGITHKCPQNSFKLMMGPFRDLKFTAEQSELYQKLA